ncbi:hypothetical protein KPL74_02595 [Bacillus sp. NP157]|nr:hypothetical protein KPL74_02595 [Bacillus sp. NP157]
MAAVLFLATPAIAMAAAHEDPTEHRLAALDASAPSDLSPADTRLLFETLASSRLLERPALAPAVVERVGRLIFRAKADPVGQQTYLDDYPGLWRRIGGDVDPLGLANLEDRVARSEGHPQLYGTLPPSSLDYPAADAQRNYASARDMLGVAVDARVVAGVDVVPLAMRPARPVPLPGVRAELLRLGEIDQAVRRWPDNPTPAQEKALIAAMEKADAYTLPRLRTIYHAHGIPAPAQVGRAATHSAFLLIQHAIADPGLMRSALAQAKWMTAHGDLPAIDYALLSDRVDCVLDHRPQQFGTQGSRNPASHWYCPIAEPLGVNTRRAALHMAPLSREEIYGASGKAGG